MKRRVFRTSGGDRSSSKSKFKPIRKPLAYSYVDVAGELCLSSNPAILREKNLATGSFTGREYKLTVKNVSSNLPLRHKKAEILEVVCKLRSQEKGLRYHVIHFYHVSSSDP